MTHNIFSKKKKKLNRQCYSEELLEALKYLGIIIEKISWLFKSTIKHYTLFIAKSLPQIQC